MQTMESELAEHHEIAIIAEMSSFSVEEIAQAAGVSLTDIQKLDKNHDGRIDAHELVEFIGKYQHHKNARRWYCVGFFIALSAVLFLVGFNMLGTIWANNLTKDTRVVKRGHLHGGLITDMNGNPVRVGAASIQTSLIDVNGPINTTMTTNPQPWLSSLANSSANSNGTRRRRLSYADLVPVKMPFMRMRASVGDRRLMHFHLVGYDTRNAGWSRRRLQTQSNFTKVSNQDLADLMKNVSVGDATRAVQAVISQVEVHVQNLKRSEIMLACALYEEGRVSFGASQMLDGVPITSGVVEIQFLSGCSSGQVSAGKFTYHGKTYTFECSSASASEECQINRYLSLPEIQEGIVSLYNQGRFPPTSADLDFLELELATLAPIPETDIEQGNRRRRELFLDWMSWRSLGMYSLFAPIPYCAVGAAMTFYAGGVGCFEGIFIAEVGAAEVAAAKVVDDVILTPVVTKVVEPVVEKVVDTVKNVVPKVVTTIRKCYPGDSFVFIRNGIDGYRKAPISDVKTGHQVLSFVNGKIDWSSVYMNGHRVASEYGDYYTIRTAHNHRMSVSGGHFVPVIHHQKLCECVEMRQNSLESRVDIVLQNVDESGLMLWKKCVVMTRGERVRVGDWVIVTNTTSATEGSRIHVERIQRIDFEQKIGFYNPYTQSGTIVVDEIVGSVHSELVFEEYVAVPRFLDPFLPQIYQFILSPLRTMFARYPECADILCMKHPLGLDDVDLTEIIFGSLACSVSSVLSFW